MPNHLEQETSPYLLQHVHNPVDWYPWNGEALQKAKRENKPILLSIGYSACHWCHVMAHESFEDPAVAEVVNASFVAIKVDREERPDLDQIYQNVAQVMTQSGGWPLTVFLTPELKPFYGGTYFPKEDAYGRPGFKRLCQALAQVYQAEPGKIATNSEKLAQAVRELEKGPDGWGSELLSRQEILEKAEGFLNAIDWENGGLQGAPKFPNPSVFRFLWRAGLAIGESSEVGSMLARAARMALVQMSRGGVFDQLGGGFHRYSVDSQWRVPHFEKMLCDNGQLVRLLGEVLLTGDLPDEERKIYLDTVERTVDWLEREMRAPEGGFYAAQDADSEGEEGKYFVWTLSELRTILGNERAELAQEHWGVTLEGNFEDRTNVLHQTSSASIPEEDLAFMRERLMQARSHRIPPATDSKVLIGWTALMVSGLAWGAEALARAGRQDAAQRTRALAERALQFVESRCLQDGRLSSTFQASRPRFAGYLDDYAYVIQAALDLSRFETRAEQFSARVQMASRLARSVLGHFRDSERPGYFFTPDDHEALLERPKEITDGALPSGVSVFLESLLWLSELDEKYGAEFSKEAEAQLHGLAPYVRERSLACTEMLSAYLLRDIGPVTLAGPLAEAKGERGWFHVLRKPGQTQWVLCHRQVCENPVASLEALKPRAESLLRSVQTPASK
jgi:uncharacterized protein YyaL (SSP411 family)